MRPASLLCLLLVGAVFSPALAIAQSATEKEARRQLEFARGEVDQRNFEKALASADSALRLEPSLYEAFVFKALAYEGLGDATKAEGYLVAYSDLAAPGQLMPEAAVALTRIRSDSTPAPANALGDKTVVTTAIPDLSPDQLPSIPQGSEALTAWLLLQQRARAAEAQRNVGLATLVGGGALAGVAGGVMGWADTESQTGEYNPNVASGHAAATGALITGGVLFAVGIPLALSGAVQAKKARDGADFLSTAQAPRFEIGETGLALRFP